MQCVGCATDDPPSVFASPTAVVLSAGAVACAMMSVLTLVREALPDAPVALEAIVETPRIGEQVAFDEFQREPGLGGQDPDDRAPSARALGVVVSFDAIVRGFRDEQLLVCWSLYAVERRSRAVVARLGTGCERLPKAEADFQRISRDVWVPVSRCPNWCIVHIGLFRDKTRLDLALSRAFKAGTA
jgi:hypothetical protein